MATGWFNAVNSRVCHHALALLDPEPAVRKNRALHGYPSGRWSASRDRAMLTGLLMHIVNGWLFAPI